MAGVDCSGRNPLIVNTKRKWKETERRLVDVSANKELQCKENRLEECTCVDPKKGERFHGEVSDFGHQQDVILSLERPKGGRIMPGIEWKKCLQIKGDRIVQVDMDPKPAVNCNYFTLGD